MFELYNTASFCNHFLLVIIDNTLRNKDITPQLARKAAKNQNWKELAESGRPIYKDDEQYYPSLLIPT